MNAAKRVCAFFSAGALAHRVLYPRSMRSIFKFVVIGGIAAVIWRIQKVLMARAEREDDSPPSPFGTDVMLGEDVELRESEDLDDDDLERLYDLDSPPPGDPKDVPLADLGVAGPRGV